MPLSNIKKNDKVTLLKSDWKTPLRILIAERVNKKSFSAGNILFYFDGTEKRTEKWQSTRKCKIYEPKDDVHIELRAKRLELRIKISSIDLKSLSTKKLEEIVNIIERKD